MIKIISLDISGPGESGLLISSLVVFSCKFKSDGTMCSSRLYQNLLYSAHLGFSDCIVVHSTIIHLDHKLAFFHV
jgi:hypothetical protein